MSFETRRIRGSSVAVILVGALVTSWGFAYGGGLWLGNFPYLSAPYQVGETVAGLGFFLIVYGLIRLYRRKGDYDDFGGPGPSEEEDWRTRLGPRD